MECFQNIGISHEIGKAQLVRSEFTEAKTLVTIVWIGRGAVNLHYESKVTPQTNYHLDNMKK